MIFGFGSVIITHSMFNQNSNGSSAKADPVTELQLISYIYDIGITNKNDELEIWTVAYYTLTALSGFVSMVSIKNMQYNNFHSLQSPNFKFFIFYKSKSVC